ncbi:MAG: tripartite tricarboxylate transporter substrate-binding protein [Lautropia sp.]
MEPERDGTDEAHDADDVDDAGEARRRLLRWIGATGAVAAAARAAPVGAAPVSAVGPVRILVGRPPAGTLDVVARTLALKWQARSGRRHLVENRTGASGLLALRALADAPTDGSVMLLASRRQLETAPGAATPVDMRANGPAIVGEVAATGLVLACGPQVPAAIRSVDALVAWVRTAAVAPLCGNDGDGALADEIARRFAAAAGLALSHVAYRDEVAALREAAAGEVAMAIGTEGSVLPIVRAGRLRAIAIAGAARSPFAPGVATFDEAGYRGLELRERFVAALPDGAAAPVVGALSDAIRAALRDGDVRDVWSRLALSRPPEASAGAPPPAQPTGR